jgi:hypothetical protein
LLAVRDPARHPPARQAEPARPPGSGLWRTRASRFDDTNLDTVEQRRRQRIDAASRMVNHLVSLVIWIVATIVAFHLLDVAPAFFLSSAGFLGAALAIGGQHKVNDYLTGLSVHFEDRYGVGDEIIVEVGWLRSGRRVVDHIGLFSTRVRDDAVDDALPEQLARDRAQPVPGGLPHDDAGAGARRAREPTTHRRSCAASPVPTGSPTWSSSAISSARVVDR